MDYKDKLKLAKEALDSGSYDKETIEYIFPELAESEDEKIRKELIEFVKSRGGFKQEYIAWLEKQGEQSSLNINRECLKGIKRVQEYQDLSDWEKEFDKIASMYAHNKNQEGYNDSWYVKERAAEMLYYAKKELEKQGGQKPAWSEEDEVMIKVFDSIIRYIVEVVDKDALERFGTNREELFSWLKSLRPQSKQEWSEEDDWIKTKIIKVLLGCETFLTSEETNECIDWIKSIKQRLKGKS